MPELTTDRIIDRIKELAKNKGYETHYTLKTGKEVTMLTFSKYFDQYGNAAEKLSDAAFSIGLNVLVNSEFTFEFLYITKRWGFRFKSGKMAPLSREDFDKVEKSFVHYAKSLNFNHPF